MVKAVVLGAAGLFAPSCVSAPKMNTDMALTILRRNWTAFVPATQDQPRHFPGKLRLNYCLKYDFYGVSWGIHSWACSISSTHLV